MKKIKLHSETVYVLGILILSFSVAMITATNFGVSMIVAPAYLLSLKLPFLTFGQSEYIVQGLLFIVFCILMKKIKLMYFFSFITGIFYGAVLDLWRAFIPHFNPAITTPGVLPITLKVIYFVLGMSMTSFSIALLFRAYIYPQVYDFFVKGICEHYSLDRGKFKSGFDASFFLISLIMTFLLFGAVKGIGIGTIIMTVFNGLLIATFGKFIDKYFEITVAFPRFAKLFEL